METRNATIDGLTGNQDDLSWNETEAALPLPFKQKNAADTLLLRLTDIEQQLNQEPLRITGLQPGHYNLTIDDKTVGTFTAAELEASINLALYETPMQNQAQAVAYKVSNHVETRHIALRLAIDGANAETLGSIRKAEAEDESRVYEAAVPRPHRYHLVRIKSQP